MSATDTSIKAAARMARTAIKAARQPNLSTAAAIQYLRQAERQISYLETHAPTHKALPQLRSDLGSLSK